MDTTKQREEFETWAEDAGGLRRGYLKKHRTVMGGYSIQIYTHMWQAWQAAIASIEIELPSLKQADTGERYVWSDGVSNYQQDVIEAIKAAGLRVKS